MPLWTNGGALRMESGDSVERYCVGDVVGER